MKEPVLWYLTLCVCQLQGKEETHHQHKLQRVIALPVQVEYLCQWLTEKATPEPVAMGETTMHAQM